MNTLEEEITKIARKKFKNVCYLEHGKPRTDLDATYDILDMMKGLRSQVLDSVKEAVENYKKDTIYGEVVKFKRDVLALIDKLKQ